MISNISTHFASMRKKLYNTIGCRWIVADLTAGRIVTMFSSFVGIAIVALPAGIITAGYMECIDTDE